MKTIVWIVVVVLVVVGVLFYSRSSDTSMMNSPESASYGETVTTKDTSNASLDADLEAIDSQLLKLDAETSAADKSMSSEPSSF